MKEFRVTINKTEWVVLCKGDIYNPMQLLSTVLFDDFIKSSVSYTFIENISNELKVDTLFKYMTLYYIGVDSNNNFESYGNMMTNVYCNVNSDSFMSDKLNTNTRTFVNAYTEYLYDMSAFANVFQYASVINRFGYGDATRVSRIMTSIGCDTSSDIDMLTGALIVRDKTFKDYENATITDVIKLTMKDFCYEYTKY